jgi:hypothetical protein
VLKSILQKSVRRRRPLPAVRVAMELMDKATGEILRRLPIIILEDSSLHPDFPLLVWTMVAESKVCSFVLSLLSNCFFQFDCLAMTFVLAGLCSSTSAYHKDNVYRLRDGVLSMD